VADRVSSHELILASHVILSTYGFWLPNDPRGSWSRFVASWELFMHGKATKVEVRHSVAHVVHDVDQRRAAKADLKYPPVRFTGIQAACVARGFATAIQDGRYIFYACCILPEHVHLVVADHARPVRQIVGHLKANAVRQLREENLYPGEAPSPWGRGCWAVYLYSEADILRSVRYVENNPLKEAKRKQVWSFVTPLAP
jgi:REP element-mobilizing transposase RayT